MLNDPLNLIDPYGLNWQSVVWSGVKGAAYGAAGAVVIGGAAAGAVFLGAPVAVVTGVVGVVGVVGGVYTFSSIVSNISSGNWNGLAFNAGSIVGGAGAGYALGGAAADIVNGGPSSSGWSLSGDLAMGYNPGLGSIGDWLSTGPTASSMGGAMAAGGAWRCSGRKVLRSMKNGVFMSPQDEAPTRRGGLSLAFMLLAMPIPVAILQALQVAQRSGTFELRFAAPAAVGLTAGVICTLIPYQLGRLAFRGLRQEHSKRQDAKLIALYLLFCGFTLASGFIARFSMEAILQRT